MNYGFRHELKFCLLDGFLKIGDDFLNIETVIDKLQVNIVGLKIFN